MIILRQAQFSKDESFEFVVGIGVNTGIGELGRAAGRAYARMENKK